MTPFLGLLFSPAMQTLQLCSSAATHPTTSPAKLLKNGAHHPPGNHRALEEGGAHDDVAQSLDAHRAAGVAEAHCGEGRANIAQWLVFRFRAATGISEVKLQGRQQRSSRRGGSAQRGRLGSKGVCSTLLLF